MQIQDYGTTKCICKKFKPIQSQSMQRSSSFCLQSPQSKKIRKASHSSYNNHSQAETFHDSFSFDLDNSHEENNSILISEILFEKKPSYKQVTEAMKQLHIDEIQEEPQLQENDKGSQDDHPYYYENMSIVEIVELEPMQNLTNTEQQFI